MTDYLDANDQIIILKTVASNTNIEGYTANTPVIVVGSGDANSFSNINLLVIDYSDQIAGISTKLTAILTSLDQISNNANYYVELAANVGIKTVEAFSWMNAGSLARLGLPYQLQSFNVQAEPGTPFLYPDEAYEVYNNSSANLVNLRSIAATIPPYVDDTETPTVQLVIFSNTAPPPPTSNSTKLWFNTSDPTEGTGGGNMFVYYNDGTSGQWVPT